VTAHPSNGGKTSSEGLIWYVNNFCIILLYCIICFSVPRCAGLFIRKNIWPVKSCAISKDLFQNKWWKKLCRTVQSMFSCSIKRELGRIIDEKILHCTLAWPKMFRQMCVSYLIWSEILTCFVAVYEWLFTQVAQSSFWVSAPKPMINCVILIQRTECTINPLLLLLIWLLMCYIYVADSNQQISNQISHLSRKLYKLLIDICVYVSVTESEITFILAVMLLYYSAVRVVLEVLLPRPLLKSQCNVMCVSQIDGGCWGRESSCWHRLVKCAEYSARVWLEWEWGCCQQAWCHVVGQFFYKVTGCVHNRMAYTL